VGGHADLWDSGKVASSQTVAIEYAGRILHAGQRAYWTVQVWDERGAISQASQAAWWEMGLLKPSDWSARWIGYETPAPKTEEEQFGEAPAPLLRKEVRIGKPIERARAYVSGLGYYELSINGAKVGDHVLDPGWTAYAGRVLYAAYDVTRAFRQGPNAIGIMLGNGFYNPLPLRMWGHLNLREHLAIGAPRALLQVEITYRDGTRQTIATDTTWKTSEGPIRKNSVYLGEEYDAQREQPGWNLPGFADANWKKAVAATPPGGVLTAQFAPPIRATRHFAAQKVTQQKPGVFIFDLGQNFAGWARLKVAGGSPGTRIMLRYGELLYPDGRLNPMTSVAGQIKGRRVPEGSQEPSTAVQTDVYTCKGGGSETYTPRFTFHGFRYVEVTGYPGQPPLSAIEGIGLNADIEKVGSFACSNPLLDQIHTAMENTFLSNVFSVQSDCPHREKFGYGGDIVATSETAMLNFDMARFYEKSVLDLADSVRPNGGFTETSPFVGIADAGLGEDAGPVEWGTAHPQLVWQRYVVYGDRKTLREQYPRARKWFALLRSKAVNGILDNGISDHESLVPKPTALTGTAFYYYNARLLAKMAQALGHVEERRDYDREAASIAAAFNQRFLKPGGRYDSATQACQAMALAYGLTPPSEEAAALEVLTHDVVEGHGGHLTTGIFGTQAMLGALSDRGRADVAYTIASQTTFPSWGWMLKNGATTLWEHWEFSDNTFSHNHPMFGSVSGWMMKSLAGIGTSSDAIGFDKLRIRPCIVDGLTWARGSYHSARGMVRTEWRKDGGALTLHVTLPPNTSAEVFVPARRQEDVRESGKPAGSATGVRFLRMAGGAAVYRVGSGEYTFMARGG
jgi:alpha-L-rhamnosidase